MSKKGKYFHGTCADHLSAIMKQGIQPTPGTTRIWNDSFPNLVYLWDDSHKECNGWDSALMSGECVLVFASDPRIVIIEVEASIDMFFPDTSSENMADCGAVACYGVAKRYITKISVSENLACFVPFAIASYLANESGKHYLIPEYQQKAAKAVDTNKIFIPEMDFKFTTYYDKNSRTSRS